jgi:gas vesicle protein
MNEEKKETSPWLYLLGGMAVGATLGVLFAPKKGSELRADIGDWTKKRSAEGKVFLTHAKERAEEAIAAVKERTHLVKS